MLLPAKQGFVSEEKNCKGDIVKFFYSSYSKMIFALLTKSVIFYMRFSSIDIEEPSLLRSPPMAFG